jgi:DNA ligase (NAD+)
MIEQLKENIIKANASYRKGNPIMSDSEYDTLLEELALLSPDDDLLSLVGHVVVDESRKRRLPIDMASMNKIKSMDDVNDWCRLKGISKSEIVIITPKFDGLSLCVNELDNSSSTRGDGTFGQQSDEHYKLIGNHLDVHEDVNTLPFTYTYGEVMMAKKKFEDDYSKDFANPRNLVAGLLNSKSISESLKDCDYIKYGAICRTKFSTKKEIIDELNNGQRVKVNYHICMISELTEDLLIDLFHKLSPDYEIDGLIIEINDISIQNRLGRETSSNNPVWARAFKHPSFEQTAESEVIGISWNISKQGLLKPILHITPIKLDGVTVSNVTGNNARFVKDMGIGVGAKVLVKRSGMVIPLIVDVLETVDFIQPTIEGVDIGWNEAGIELITLTETDDQKLKKNVAFFEILEADNVSEGVITQLWEAGHTTIKDILNLTKVDLEKIDRFGKRKSSIVFNSIQKSVKDVQLSKLQHATGIFRGLGSKKLVLLEQFTEKPSIDNVMVIDGFAEKSAKSYIDSYDEFFEFIKDLPVTIEEKVEVAPVGDDLIGKQFVFTGVRRKDLNEVIESRGGKIGSGVSKNTSYLVVKATGSGSSKENKAIKLKDSGQDIEVITVEQLEVILG